MQVWCCTKINDRKQPQLREVHPRVVCNFIRLEISFKKKLDQTERKNACQAHAMFTPGHKSAGFLKAEIEIFKNF